MPNKIYPPDHGSRVSEGLKKWRIRNQYLQLGCPIPPPSPKEILKEQLKNDISKDEVTLHLLKTKQL